MQNFMIVAIVLLVPAVVFAGTRLAHPGEESRALAIWDKLCSNGRDGGIEQGIFVHCKHALGAETYHLSETIRSDINAPQREQYIFVQPPALHFDHKLAVQGGGSIEPKTIVYVQPARTSHSYTADLQVKDSDHVKPELVFLGAASGTGSSGVDRQPQPPQPIKPVLSHGASHTVV